MLTTTQKFPMIALAGAISFLATLAAFTAMTSPARADSQLSDLPPTNLPRPGFADPYNKTPIVGYTAGQSQIRLANMRDEGTVTNYISIWGQDEKRWLGSVQVDVPAKASLAIEPHLMLQTFAPVNWSQPIVLYVENGREKQLWQHVRNDERTGRIEDTSVCTHSPHQDYIPAQQVVLNAQINRVGPRHSLVLLHNFSEQDAVFEARMYDAATGAYLGKLDIPLAARCIEKGARVLRPNGKPLDQNSISMALAMRDLTAHLRETGEITGGPSAFTPRDRSRFLDALENAVQAQKRRT
jgi:hypothetical protein